MKMKVKFENLEFNLPSSTILGGPMAAAKPLFAQKFIVNILNNYKEYNVLYFATSSPVCGILRNLEIFGLEKKNKERILFFDYDPSCSKFRKVNDGYYIGNFADKGHLEDALSHANEKSIVVIPSFTLLLVGTKDKAGLADILVRNVFEQKLTSFIAINTSMFEDINKILENKADNVIHFTRKDRKVNFKVLKFKGEGTKEGFFEFPVEMFQRTKKEVAERTSELIKGKKER
jgi:hypothetical protein